MSLDSLFKAKGTTGGEVALALSSAFGFVDPVLFTRIDQGRQPLPTIVMNAIAIVLKVKPVEVQLEVAKIVVDVRAISRRPVPPIIGDEFQATRLALPPGT